MDYNLTLVTPPDTEPVSLTDAKSYLRIDTTNDTLDDAFVESLIVAAREYCEDFQNRAYVTQTWEMSLPGFPFASSNPLNGDKAGSIIEIPKGKLQTVGSFTYKDTAGLVTTLTPEVDYVVSNRGILGRVCPPFGKIFPLAILYPLDPVVIQFTCGYGADTEVPPAVKQAMMMLVSHWYENRLAVGKVGDEIAFAVRALLSMQRVIPT